MTVASIQTAIKPALEGDFALPGEFPLEAGGVLRGAQLHYALYGEMNAARDDVVLVCHALSGSALVSEWWPAMFSAEGLIDPEKDAVLGINILGSCYGSTGPSSIDPETGRVYGASFPLVGVRDVVRAQALLLDALEIQRLTLAIGASIGGMQVLQWAIDFPARVARAIAIAASPLSAMGLGLNHLQRQAIMLDPDWKNGNYAPDLPPRRGLRWRAPMVSARIRRRHSMPRATGASRIEGAKIRGGRRVCGSDASMCRATWTIREKSSTRASTRTLTW